MRARYLNLCLAALPAIMSLIATPAEAQDRGAVFAGVSGGEDQSVYAGALMALPGASLGKGLAVRVSASAGTYEYAGGPGIVEADFSGVDAAVVYQASSPSGYANFGLGARYIDTSLSPSDPANEREGGHWDATVSVDGAKDMGLWRAGLYSSYGVSMRDYYVRADLTRAVNDQVRLGAEVVAQGDRMYDRQKYGAVVAFSPMTAWEIRLSGGASREAEGDYGGYGAVSFVRTF